MPQPPGVPPNPKNREYITRDRLCQTLEKLGCRYLEMRRDKCDFWLTPRGEPFTVADPGTVGSGGTLLYHIQYARDLVAQIAKMDSEFAQNAARDAGFRLRKTAIKSIGRGAD
ncbi:hypothetical protein HL658_29705 [Azospirillum sp. RWY-5-1]|uniref:Uncharacterized protein n=1 Tax=Azospirillum oleiclasticum TaxID=2735135 RepID=A0ABX2TGI9_9PROT|nr:hypothetical protein [Azospirillum oleiclasticum]NYZ16742.1 hypothetical protein [Azospirillum oleiclasticum]NYZ23356.1 hypothetical protein [Azospirillum oleiclasticum]